MSEKSHVTMEQHQCPICGKVFDTDAILLHPQLKPVFDRKTVTGNSLCPECAGKIKEGYFALVEISNPPAPGQDRVLPEKAVRTGNMAYIKRRAAQQIFKIPIPDTLDMVFVEPGVIKKIQEIVNGHEEGAGPAPAQQDSD